MRTTTPAFYKVERIGTQDPPDSAYVVLDLTQDRLAREVLWLLVNRYRNWYGPSVRADELERALRDSEDTFAHNVRTRNQGVKARRVRAPNRLVARRRS